MYIVTKLNQPDILVVAVINCQQSVGVAMEIFLNSYFNNLEKKYDYDSFENILTCQNQEFRFDFMYKNQCILI